MLPNVLIKSIYQGFKNKKNCFCLIINYKTVLVENYCENKRILELRVLTILSLFWVVFIKIELIYSTNSFILLFIIIS